MTMAATPAPALEVHAQHANEEQARLTVLDRYSLIHTFDEPEYDDLVALACDIFDAPMATLSLLSPNETFFKARIGLDMATIPREHSFTSLVLASPVDPVAVEDATLDARLLGNPYVTGHPHLRAYLAAPVKTADDVVLGAFEVVDVRPRRWSDREIRHITTLGSMVEAHLELRRLLHASTATSSSVHSGTGRVPSGTVRPSHS